MANRSYITCVVWTNDFCPGTCPDRTKFCVPTVSGPHSYALPFEFMDPNTTLMLYFLFYFFKGRIQWFLTRFIREYIRYPFCGEINHNQLKSMTRQTFHNPIPTSSIRTMFQLVG
uniref:Uncharacterized protein n=1 Tax=Strigamia maritima TaxID=126957 RepID=T1J9J3_STRMM